jgi:hypothetical protein
MNNDLQKELWRAIGAAGRELRLEADLRRALLEELLQQYGRRMSAERRRELQARIDNLHRQQVELPDIMQLASRDELARAAARDASTPGAGGKEITG